MRAKTAVRVAALGVFFLTGCASYDRPPAVVNGSVYTGVKNEDKFLMPSDITVLTLEQAQNIAMQNNPSFQSKYFAIAAARANYYQSFASYFPTVNATFEAGQTLTKNYSYRGPTNIRRTESDAYTPGFSGQLLIFDSLNREMTILAARHNWQATEAEEDDARRLLIQSVANAYNGVMQSAAEMRIALADMDYNADMLRDTQLKFEAGAVSLSEVLNFKIQYNKAESNLITAQYTYAVNKYSLAQLLGLTEGTIPESVKFPLMPTEDADILPDVSVYLDLALANRPDLKALRELLESQKYTFWSTLAAFGPTFTANYSLSYSRSNGVTSYSGYDQTTRSDTGALGYGLNASWNLFNGGNDYFAARAAQANMIQADYNVAQNWIQVIVDVRTAYDNYITNVKQTKLYQKTYDLTKQTRDLVEEEYKAGSAELTRMNEAQRDLVNAEMSLVASVVQMANAKAQLEAAANIR